MSTSFDSEVNGALPTRAEYAEKEADWLLSFTNQTECDLIKDLITPAPAPVMEIEIEFDKKDDDRVIIEDDEGEIRPDNIREESEGGSITIDTGDSIDRVKAALVEVEGGCLGAAASYKQLKADEKCSDYQGVENAGYLIRNITVTMFPVIQGVDCQTGGETYGYSDKPLVNPMLRFMPQESVDELNGIGDALADVVEIILG